MKIKVTLSETRENFLPMAYNTAPQPAKEREYECSSIATQDGVLCLFRSVSDRSSVMFAAFREWVRCEETES